VGSQTRYTSTRPRSGNRGRPSPATSTTQAAAGSTDGAHLEEDRQSTGAFDGTKLSALYRGYCSPFAGNVDRIIMDSALARLAALYRGGQVSQGLSVTLSDGKLGTDSLKQAFTLSDRSTRRRDSLIRNPRHGSTTTGTSPMISVWRGTTRAIPIR
jgi:hypothetical protein